MTRIDVFRLRFMLNYIFSALSPPGVNVASGPLVAIAGGPIATLSAGKWSGPLAAIAAIVSGPLAAIAIFSFWLLG